MADEGTGRVHVWASTAGLSLFSGNLTTQSFPFQVVPGDSNWDSFWERLGSFLALMGTHRPFIPNLLQVCVLVRGDLKTQAHIEASLV